MSVIETTFRGNDVSWRASFADVDGTQVIPESVSVFVDFRTSEIDDTEREIVEIAMSQESDGVFTATWSTVDASAGWAFWSVRAINPSAAEDGQIKIKANPANPDPASA